MRVDRPIFFVGMPRSGTTVLFEALSAHPDLAWLSQHFNRAPRFPILSSASRLCDLSHSFRKAIHRSDQSQPWIRKLRIAPAEAYDIWKHYCGEKFLYDYLLGVRATAGERRATRTMVSEVVRHQGKTRFATKITGPARIGYLASIFPDARFVHVIRDGRAVVQSLMKKDFWKNTYRLHEPAWSGGIPDAYLDEWYLHHYSPVALAAIQWKNVIERAREERLPLKPEQYTEVRYEDFVCDPHGQMAEISAFCDLPPSEKPRDFLRDCFELRNMNFQFRASFSPEDMLILEDVLGCLLDELGYTDTSTVNRCAA